MVYSLLLLLSVVGLFLLYHFHGAKLILDVWRNRYWRSFVVSWYIGVLACIVAFGLDLNNNNVDEIVILLVTPCIVFDLWCLRWIRKRSRVPLRKSIYGTTVQGDGGKGSGVLFHLWVPGAEKVSLVGKFLPKGSAPLSPLGGNHWNALIHTAKVNDRYHYRVTFPRGSGGDQRILDPRAPCLVLSSQAAAATAAAPPTDVKGDAAKSGTVELDQLECLVCDPSNDGFSWTDQLFVPPDLSRLVIYELHVATFGVPSTDSSTTTTTTASTASASGGAVSGNEMSGTFLGCIPRLAYLADLGVNAIELMPLNEDKHRVCWGYDPISYFAVHSAFGTPTHLKQLVNEAHRFNIAVIIDWVPNHMINGSVLSPFEGCFYKTGTQFGPRPNYNNPEIRKMLKDSLMMWLEDFHMDGVRVDSTCTMRAHGVPEGEGHCLESWTLMLEANDMAKSLAKPKICIAEDLQGDENINYVAGFDSQWDGHFFYVLYNAVKALTDEARPMDQVAGIVSCSNRHSLHRVIYTENHDTAECSREKHLPNAISEDPDNFYYSLKRSMLASTILLTSPGVPLLLQGQELCEMASFLFPVPPIVTWANLPRYHGSLYVYYRTLVRLRAHDSPALASPHVRVHHVNHERKVIAYCRFDMGKGGDHLVVVANFSNDEIHNYRVGVPRGPSGGDGYGAEGGGAWRVVVNSDEVIYHQSFGGVGLKRGERVEAQVGDMDGFYWFVELNIGRYAVIILEQDR